LFRHNLFPLYVIKFVQITGLEPVSPINVTGILLLDDICIATVMNHGWFITALVKIWKKREKISSANQSRFTDGASERIWTFQR